MRAVAVMLAIGVALTGCSTAQPSTVTVFAAASLTEAFNELAAEFEAEHPGVNVVVNYGGSSTLAYQILEGAPADVFAAASLDTMSAVTPTFRAFATNTLQIAVPVGNPGGVTSLSDFARLELAIAVCAREVPCGSAAEEVFRAAGVAASVDTFEQDVKAVLSKVVLGEVDAGLVYRTDVIAAGDAVTGIEFGEAAGVVTEYPIAALTSKHSAIDFVEFVLSDAGQRVLRLGGFGAP